MIEQLANLLQTDEPTIGIALLAALAGAWLVREALESNAIAACYYPLLVALALAGGYVAIALGLAMPLSQMSFREADAAESLQALAFLALAIGTGVALGSVLVVRLQQLLARKAPPRQEL
jgi:hypothetical protein